MAGVLAAAAVAVPEGDRLRLHRPGWLALEGGRVVDAGEGVAPGALELGDVVLGPGFVDLQINGVHDVDFAIADEDGWRRAGRSLLGHGVTSYCPTLVSAPLGTYGPTLERIAAARDDAATRGLPSIIGAHLEGPFLGGAPGAHAPELLRLAQPEWLSARLDAQPGLVRIVTLAPEADPMLAATRLLSQRGVIVAIGQSSAKGEVSLAVILIIGFGLHNATEGLGICAPLTGETERPSWTFLGALGLIGGAPTFLGTALGQAWVNQSVSILFLALAAGSILYVVIELLNAGRVLASKTLVTWGILLGLFLGFATDFILVAAGV